MRLLLLVVVLLSTLATMMSFMVRLPSKHVHANKLRLSASLGQLGGSAKYQIVLVRHGESTWNQENKFTGWYDCPLSEKGHKEAIAAGKLLKENEFKFDLAYTSTLQRAIRTLWHSLEETGLMYIPIVNAWQLNER